MLKSLASDEVVKKVTLIGHGPLGFTQNYGALVIDYPSEASSEYPAVLKIEF